MPGHDGVLGNEQVDHLASTAPELGTIKMNKEDTEKTIYEHMLVDDARILVDETTMSRSSKFWTLL